MNLYILVHEDIAGVIAFLAVVLLMPLAVRLAFRYGFVDAPGGRKQHEMSVPPIGGLVIFSVMMVVGLFSGQSIEHYWPLYLGLILIMIVGAFDDYRHISPWIKFTMQFVAATVIVVSGQAQLYHLGDLFGFGDLNLWLISIPFSIIAVVLFINAINLMDGLDGLAGGISFGILFWLMLACFIAGEPQNLKSLYPLFGALLGFLVFNLRSPICKKASVFLGDAGSMGLGLVLAWFCIDLTQEPHPVILKPISIAWLLALPIIDTCAQFYRRSRAGKHPFSPDRGHFHHHFIEAGFSVGQATACVLLISFVFGGIGYGFIEFGVPQWVLCLVWIVMILTHMAISEKPERYIGFFKRFITKS